MPRIQVPNHTIVPLVVLAALLALAWPVAAQATDTVLVEVNLHGPAGVTFHAGPLAVPDPILPNPAYEALATGAPVLDATAPLADLEDAPDGLYVATAGGAPVELVGWSPGLEQHRIAPVEFAVENLHMRASLPLEVDAHPASSGSGLTLAGRIVNSAPSSFGPAGTAGGVAAPNVMADEALPFSFPSIGQESAPAPFQSQLAAPAPAVATSQAADAAAVGGDTTAPLAAVLAIGVALFLAKLLLPLYHRFKKKTALDNPTRQKVYELLRDAPGSSAAELGERSALHVTTVKYHLDVLRRLGMVGEQTVDGRRRFFSYENGDRAEMLERALLDEPAARAVYQQIIKAPGRPFIEVAKALGMRKEHVHYHVQKLSKHGLIADKWEGGRRLLFPSTPPAAAPAQPPTTAPALPPALPAAPDRASGATEVQG